MKIQILGHHKKWGPHTLPCTPEATVWQPETPINVNIPPIIMLFFFLLGNKASSSWSNVDRRQQWIPGHVTFVLCPESWKAYFQWPREMIAAQWGASAPARLQETKHSKQSVGSLQRVSAGLLAQRLSTEIWEERKWGMRSASASQTVWDAETCGYLLVQEAGMDKIRFHSSVQGKPSGPTRRFLPPEMW